MKITFALLVAIVAHVIVTEAAIVREAGESRPASVQRRQWTGTFGGSASKSGYSGNAGVSYKAKNGWKSDLGFGYSSKVGLNTNAGVSYNKGPWKTNLGAGYSQHGGFNSKAGLSYSKGRFKAGLNGGFSQGGRWNVGGTLSYRFRRQLRKRDEIKQKNVVVTKVEELDKVVNGLVSKAEKTGANGVKIYLTPARGPPKSLTPAQEGSETEEESEEEGKRVVAGPYCNPPWIIC